MNSDKTMSITVDAMRVALMVQIIVGHAVALVVPTMPDILHRGEIWSADAFYRLIFGFGRESAVWFIIVSGLYSARFIWTNTDGGFNAHYMIHKRCARLLFVGLSGLFFTFLADSVGMYFFDAYIYNNNGLNYNVDSHRSIYLFTLNSISLQPTFSLTFGSNGPIWTLGYLVQFLCIAILFRILFNKLIYTQLALIITSALFILFNKEFSMFLLAWTIAYPIVRFAGVICSFFVKIGFFLPILAIIIFVLGRVSSQEISLLLVFLSVIVLRMGIDVIGSNKHLMCIMQSLSQWSNASFGAYVLHMPILFLLFSFVDRINIQESGYNSWVVFVVSIITIFVSFAIGNKLVLFVNSFIDRSGSRD